jgi:ribosomal protein S18 acetylase RimI-like enzyme
MTSVQFTSDLGEHTATIQRVADLHWHALEDDQVVARGEASPRPDGRLFLSIDSWHDALFDPLAAAMLADLPRPLYTVVDESDTDLTANWRRNAFTTRRHEWEYLVPTDPQVTGLGSAPPPAGVTILPVGKAEKGPLAELDRVIRDEVEASIGWQEMPAEVLPRPAGVTVVDPAKYAVAARGDHYVGLIRVVPVTRRPRIGLLAVRVDERRRGIGRALLAHVLGALHNVGTETAVAEVNETNEAATALFDGINAQRLSSNLELVPR